MASSRWFCVFMIICLILPSVYSLYVCLKNVLPSTCNDDPIGCIWSRYTSSCICNTDKTTNIIYVIDSAISTNPNLHTITSSIETTSTKTITFQHTQTTENSAFETAIDDAIALFASYNTNYGEIRNILIIFDELLSPFIQSKLQTNDIQSITVSSNDPHILSFISCEIQSYQHHISIQRQQRVLLQTNTYTETARCCQCLSVTETVGCGIDTECEDIVCDTDHICCQASIHPSDPAIGWDETCVTMAHKICNENVLNIQNPIAIPPSDITTTEYNTCWEIQSNIICNEYATRYGCMWSISEQQCMCITDDITTGVNVIYLVDISLDSMPSNNDYQAIVSIIEDVIQSTLRNNDTTHSLIILYDENVYIHLNNDDMSQIQRTENTDILYAIDTALNQFILFNNNNKRVLVIFNGAIQDPNTVCTKRNELDKTKVSVIVNAYTVHSETFLECLVNNAAYNDISDIGIHSAYPLKAKISWDICTAALNPVSNPSTNTSKLHVPQELDTTVEEQKQINPTQNPTEQQPVIAASPIRYMYKQAPITRVFPCLEPEEICTDGQIFDETQCECRCIDARPSICPDLMIYNAKTCKCELYSVLVSSRLDTLNAECASNGDIDVLFVVDSSCGIDAVSCDNMREFIGNLVEVIKISDNHRVGLVECGETFGAQYRIQIGDKYFNDIDNNINFDRMDVFDIYFNMIKTGLQCLSGTVVPKRECLEDAVRIISEDNDVNRERMRKIVYIEVCGVSEGEDPCDTDNDIQWIESIADGIEIILVNIGDIKEYNHECLLRNGRETVYKFDGFDFNLERNIEIRNILIEDICGINDGDALTFQSTNVPVDIDIDIGIDTVHVGELDLGVVSNLDVDSNGNGEGVIPKDIDVITDNNGDIGGNGNGNDNGDIEGNHNGDIEGNNNGDIEGNNNGDIEGNNNGDIEGNNHGDIEGNNNVDIEGNNNGDIPNGIIRNNDIPETNRFGNVLRHNSADSGQNVRVRNGNRNGNIQTEVVAGSYRVRANQRHTVRGPVFGSGSGSDSSSSDSSD